MSQRSGGKQASGVGTRNRDANDRRSSNVPSLPYPLPIEDAITFLISKELIPNESVNMKNLVTGLLHLSLKTNSTILTDRIRAFAAIAQDLETTKIADGVAKAVSEILERSTKTYISATEDAQDAMQEVVSTLEKRSNQIERQIRDMEEKNEELKEHVKALQETLAKPLPSSLPILDDRTFQLPAPSILCCRHGAPVHHAEQDCRKRDRKDEKDHDMRHKRKPFRGK